MNLLPSGLARLIVSVAIVRRRFAHALNDFRVTKYPFSANIRKLQKYKSEPNVNHTQVIEQRFITN